MFGAWFLFNCINVQEDVHKSTIWEYLREEEDIIEYKVSAFLYTAFLYAAKDCLFLDT